MKILKRDFVPTGTISISKRELTSGKAYFLQENENEDIKYASKDYIKENYPNYDYNSIIDLTKGLIKTFNHKTGVNGGSGGNDPVDIKTRDLNIVHTYLILTQEKMRNFNGYNRNRHPDEVKILLAVYNDICLNKELSQSQIDSVLKLEKNKKRYSLKNLYACYAYEYKIQIAIEILRKNKSEGYMIGMLDALHTFLYLTEGQVEGMKKWFKNLPKDLKETKFMEFDYIPKKKPA